MSLKDIIQRSQFGSIAEELKNGIVPENCTLSKFLKKDDEVLNINSPVNGLTINSGNQHIAAYHKEIQAWVLNDNISPDIIPTIAGIDTISS